MLYWDGRGRWRKEFSYRLNVHTSGQLDKYASYLDIFLWWQICCAYIMADNVLGNKASLPRLKRQEFQKRFSLISLLTEFVLTNYSMNYITRHGNGRITFSRHVIFNLRIPKHIGILPPIMNTLFAHKHHHHHIQPPHGREVCMRVPDAGK